MRLTISVCTLCLLIWSDLAHGGIKLEGPEGVGAAHPSIGFLEYNPGCRTTVEHGPADRLSSTYRISGTTPRTDSRASEYANYEPFSVWPYSDSAMPRMIRLCQDRSTQSAGSGSDETVPPGTKEQGAALVVNEDASPASPDAGLIHYRPPLRRWVRSQLLVGGFVLTGLGVLFVLPDSVTKWEGDYLADARENFHSTWTEPPVFDSDVWYLNYIAHPYCGSLAYNLMRSQGGGMFESFVFSTLQSCLWEYVWEGFAEQPSIQDLIVTPIVGSLLGELIHYGTLKMKRNGFSLLEKITVTIINPSFVVNNGYK